MFDRERPLKSLSAAAEFNLRKICELATPADLQDITSLEKIVHIPHVSNGQTHVQCTCSAAWDHTQAVAIARAIAVEGGRTPPRRDRAGFGA